MDRPLAEGLSGSLSREVYTRMTTVAIDLKRCDNSPFCPAKRVCPNGAIKPVLGGYATDENKCSGCGVCIRVCPMGAVHFS